MRFPNECNWGRSDMLTLRGNEKSISTDEELDHMSTDMNNCAAFPLDNLKYLQCSVKEKGNVLFFRSTIYNQILNVKLCSLNFSNTKHKPLKSISLPTKQTHSAKIKAQSVSQSLFNHYDEAIEDGI
jgi:hypothetical protein